MQYLPRKNRRKLVKTDADQFDTVKVMRGMIIDSALNDNFVHSLINNLRLDRDLNGLVKVAELFYVNSSFEPDGPDLQTVRSPRRILKDKKGNCVDFSTAMGSFGVAMNLPTALVICATDPDYPDNYNHVFTVINGIPFDLVINQDHVNSTYRTPPRFKQMNFRSMVGINAPYYSKITYPINYTTK